jgi:hypothetical protein
MTNRTFTVLIILAHIIWILAVVRLCVRKYKGRKYDAAKSRKDHSVESLEPTKPASQFLRQAYREA